MKERLRKALSAAAVGIAAVFTTAALFADVTEADISRALNGDGVAQLIALAVSAYIYKRWLYDKTLFAKAQRREKVCAAVTALLFALFMVIGKSQEANDELKYGIFAIVLFLGYMPLFYTVALLLFQKIPCAFTKDATRKLGLEGSFTYWLFEKHTMPGAFVAVIICRLPYLIAFYPCSMSWDGGAQIASFWGTEVFTNHHPPLISFIYGAIAWYSQAWGIPNIGMFVIPVMQTLLSAYAVAKVMELFKHFGLPYIIRWVSLAYYAAFTVWCIFDCTVIKDTLYWPLTLLFSVELIYCVLDGDWFWGRKRNVLTLFLSGLLMMQTRNNGIFVLLLSVPVALVFVKGKRKRFELFAVAAAAIIANTALNSGLYPALGVISLEAKEDTYCIMFQQTAKYGQDYPDDVTDEERELLDKIFDYDELVEAYNPQLADWVKNTLRLSEANSADHTDSEFAEIRGEYFKVWFAQFTRHPLSYVNTFIECSYGYYYPEVEPYKEGAGFYEEERYMLTDGMHSYRQKEWLAPARSALYIVSKAAQYMPGIGLLYRCGIYTWCVFFAAMYFIAKKRYAFLAAVMPGAVNILVCLISPVNSCLRYAMPTMCIVPVLIGFMWRRGEFGNKKSR